jgi:hypothetical protein
MATSPEKDRDAPDATGVQPAAGRVEFDSRGNSVWRWAKDVIDSTSILLKRLDNKDLSLEPTQKVPVIGKADKRGGRGAELGVAGANGEGGRGFDPYNSRRR